MKSVVLYGLCTQTPAVYDEILKAFPSAQIALAEPGDCAKGAALLLAGQRSVLQGPSVSVIPLPIRVSAAVNFPVSLHNLSIVYWFGGLGPFLAVVLLVANLTVQAMCADAV